MGNPYSQFHPELAAAPEGNPYAQFHPGELANGPDIVPASGGQPTRITVRPQSAAPADETPAAAPTITGSQAFGRGAANAATFNFLDELNGLVRAGGGDPDSPEVRPAIETLIAMAKGGYRKLTGDEGAQKLYDEQVGKERALTKATEEQYPGTYLAGNIAGGIAVPIGGMARGATLAGRAARGAGVGGIFGGLSGVGEGTTPEDRASRGLVGASLGGAIGGALPPVSEGVAKGVGAVLSKPINTIRAAINPDEAASRAVGRAYQEAQRVDPNAVSRLAPHEIAPGGPQTVMDALGGEGRNLARSAGNLSGGAKDILNRSLDERFETQSNRFVNWLNSTFHYPNAHAQQEAIDKLEKTVNSKAYRVAYQQGDKPVWSPELERLVGSPAVQDAMRSAITTGKDRAITQGYGGFRSPFQVTADGQLKLNRGPNGVPTFPNLQFWDYTRREISNAASKAERSGANEDAGRLKQLAGALNAELDHLVPAYQDARQGAAKFFGAENALEAGQKFVKENFNNAETRAALAKMSPTERQLFQDGFASRFIETINNVPDRADVVKRIYNSPAAKEKIELALGRQRATELEAMLRVETIMQSGLRAVQGNSTTVAQIAGLGLAGAGGGGYLGFDPTTSGLAAALATAGKKGIDARVAQRIADMLTSSDPTVLSRGIAAISKNSRLMDVLRAIQLPGARAGSGQAPKGILPPFNPTIGSRADQDQPTVPGPVNQ